MRTLKMVTLCFAVALVVSGLATAVASASEGPKFIRCVKAAKVDGKYTGKYTDKACTKPASEAEIEAGKTNKYEAVALAPSEEVSVTGKSKATTIKTIGVNGNAETVVCKKDAFVGKLSNDAYGGLVTGTFTFEDCEANGSKSDVCGNTKPGTIEYSPAQKQEVQWLEQGSKPGLDTPANPGPKFTCGSETVETGGTLVGTLENSSKGVNVLWKTSGGTQEDTRFFEEEEPGEWREESELNLFSRPSRAETTVVGTEEISAKGISVTN
jgi:hypothetical protein